MIGHKLIGKAQDLHYAYFGAGRNYGLHCLLCRVCTEFKENKVCKECIEKNGSLAWVNFRSKLPHTLWWRERVWYCKIMGTITFDFVSHEARDICAWLHFRRNLTTKHISLEAISQVSIQRFNYAFIALSIVNHISRWYANISHSWKEKSNKVSCSQNFKPLWYLL